MNGGKREAQMPVRVRKNERERKQQKSTKHTNRNNNSSSKIENKPIAFPIEFRLFLFCRCHCHCHYAATVAVIVAIVGSLSHSSCSFSVSSYRKSHIKLAGAIGVATIVFLGSTIFGVVKHVQKFVSFGLVVVCAQKQTNSFLQNRSKATARKIPPKILTVQAIQRLRFFFFSFHVFIGSCRSALCESRLKFWYKN